MPDIVVLNFVELREPPGDQLPAVAHDLAAIHATMPGFLSQTYWQVDGSETEFLAMIRYRDLESAQAATAKVANEELIVEIVQALAKPADVRWVEILEETGSTVFPPMGSFLSISDRMSFPGLQGRLQDEMARIFAELATMDGFVGSIRGHSTQFEEDVYGVVIWSRRDAFLASLPANPPYEVRLYRRFA
ncbi:MAG: hypothetical protein SNJ74_12405 [Fimbriimonadaceae bacterium]